MRKREKKNSYLAFLGLEGGREELWHKMRQYEVEEKFVKVCEGLYSEVEMRWY